MTHLFIFNRLKKILTVLLGLSMMIVTQTITQAQTQRTWSAGAGDMNWSNPANWQGNVVPGGGDIALFNNTSVGNCTITLPSIVYGLQVTSGYTGTITQSTGVKFYIGPSGAVLNGGLLVVNDYCRIWGILDVEGGSLDAEQGYMYSPEDSETYAQAVTEFCSAGLPATENQNYIRSQTILIPVQQEMQTIALTPGNQLVQTEYFDGMGRSIQTVAWQASPLGDDMVQIKDYDEHGLQLKQYLPYTAQECNGQFKDISNSNTNNAFIQQQNFYTTNTDPLIAKTSIPSGSSPVTFAENVYDNTPLNRINEQGAPGDSWKVQTAGTGHTQQANRRTNTVNEVLLWVYDQSTENATVLNASTQQPAYYPAGTLSVVEVTDENKNITTVYSDKIGRTLLKKMPKTGGTLNTYYVYDDLNQIKYVIPPLAAANQSIDGNKTFTDATYYGYQLLYAYRYDARHRTIERKLPGAGSSKVVYDFLDRPVLLQDANQAALGNWNFVKYDQLDRIILTGLYPDASTAQTLQANVNAQTILSEIRVAPGQQSGLSGISQGYSIEVLPTALVSNNILTINYYDDYNFNNDHLALDYSYSSAGLGTSEPVPFYNCTGQATGSKTRVMGTQNFLQEVIFYDKYGRTIQSQSNNHLYLEANPGNTDLEDVSTSVYDFAGRLLKTIQAHTPGGSLSPVIVQNRMTYDTGIRLKNIYQQMNSDAEVLLSTINYNELGQAVEKNLHSEDQGLHYLQSLDYRYNIRGWMTTINNSSLTNDYTTGGAYTNNDNNDLFGMQLLYDQLEPATPGGSTALNTPMFDGQLSAVKWKTNNPVGTNGNERIYTYSYDKAYRLTSALYAEKGSAGNWGSIVNNYSEQGISYDDGGNINGLNRYDQQGVVMDQLIYTYNGNQLKKVADQSLDLLNGFTSSNTAQALSSQYTYDANGNLLTDANKNISLSYNHLDLITQVTNASTGTVVNYTYDANGTMLSKQVTSTASPTSTTDYVDNFLYLNNALEYASTTEGRAEYNGTSFAYVYDIQDYLGSPRISFDKDPASPPAAPTARVVQETHYYAFGMRHGNTSVYAFGLRNDFLYTGKEVQNETGLYDFGARMYDAALGRWHSVDAMAESYSDWTPYNFVMNNPVNLIDPDGMGTGDGVGSDSEGEDIVPDPEEMQGLPENAPEGFQAVGYTMEDGEWQSTEMDAGEVTVTGTKSTEGEGVDFADNVLGILEAGDLWAYGQGGQEFGSLVASITGARTWGNIYNKFSGDGKDIISGEDVSNTGLAVEAGLTFLPIGKLGQGGKAGIKTATGVEITGFTKHGLNRAIERGVKSNAILDAVKNPLKTGSVVTDQLGRQSQRFIGRAAEVVVNPQTGKIISANPTSTSKAAKLLN